MVDKGAIERSPLENYAHQVIGAAIEVHRTLEPGFVESVYEQALAVEMTLRHLPFVQQYPVSISYKGRAVGDSRLDFLIGDCLIVELKAVESLLPIHKAQVISYLRTTGLTLGLLINFNVEILKNGIKRIIL